MEAKFFERKTRSEETEDRAKLSQQNKEVMGVMIGGGNYITM